MNKRIWGLVVIKGLNADGTEWENEHEMFLDESPYFVENYPHEFTYMEFKHHKIG